MSTSMSHSGYRLLKKGKEGVVAIIIFKGRILLLKRRNLPFLDNPGIWSFVFGGIKKRERYLDTAYREIREETGIDKRDLHLVLNCGAVVVFEGKKRIKWQNRLYVFRSRTGRVRLDIENAGFRWARATEIVNKRWYTNIFVDEKYIWNLLRRYARR